MQKDGFQPFDDTRAYRPIDVARTLKCDPSTVWRWERRGLLTPLMIGGMKRYGGAECNALIEPRPRGAST